MLLLLLLNCSPHFLLQCLDSLHISHEMPDSCSSILGNAKFLNPRKHLIVCKWLKSLKGSVFPPYSRFWPDTYTSVQAHAHTALGLRAGDVSKTRLCLCREMLIYIGLRCSPLRGIFVLPHQKMASSEITQCGLLANATGLPQ